MLSSATVQHLKFKKVVTVIRYIDATLFENPFYPYAGIMWNFCKFCLIISNPLFRLHVGY